MGSHLAVLVQSTLTEVHYDHVNLPQGDIYGEVTTIEGHGNPDALSSLQKSWIEHQVAQCGYCQSGQIMQAATI